MDRDRLEYRENISRRRVNKLTIIALKKETHLLEDG